MGRPDVKDGTNLERVTVGGRKYLRLPLHTRRFTMWGALRKWKPRNRAYHNFNNTYEGSTLMGQIDAGRVSPIVLDDWAFLKPIRAAILGWVTLACKARNAYALKITRAQWGTVLHCHPNCFDAHKKYLIEQGWIKQIDDFRPGRFKGRDGTYKHRRETNWYAPGWRLDRAWERFQRRERQKVQPILDPSPPTGQSLDQFCDPSGSDCEKQSLTRVPRAKEAPAGPVVEKPTPSASGADGPVKVSAAPTRVEKRPGGAADQEEIASGGPSSAAASGTTATGRVAEAQRLDGRLRSSASEDRHTTRRPAEARRPAPRAEPLSAGPAAALTHKRDEIIALICRLEPDIKLRRELISAYDHNPETVELSLRSWAGSAA